MHIVVALGVYSRHPKDEASRLKLDGKDIDAIVAPISCVRREAQLEIDLILHMARGSESLRGSSAPRKQATFVVAVDAAASLCPSFHNQSLATTCESSRPIDSLSSAFLNPIWNKSASYCL